MSRAEVLGGLAASLAVAALLPLTVMATTSLLGALQDEFAPADEGAEDPEADEEPEAPPVEFLEARFVRLGSELDPRRLPDRYVASRSTAPPPSTTPPTATPPTATPPTAEAPSTPPPPTGAQPAPAPTLPVPAATPPAPSEPAAATPGPAVPRNPPRAETPVRPGAVDDALTRLGDRADALSTLARPREREGDAEGIAEGTERRGDADIYLGQLYTFFRRGWTAPSSLSDAELRSLNCVVEVLITAEARVGDWRIAQSSGHEGFDETVRTRMRQAEGAALPTPPPDEAARYLHRRVSLRFMGRNGR